MPTDPHIILDDFRTCSFQDCPNPILIDRASIGEELSEEEKALLAHYLDECPLCREYAEQKTVSIENHDR